MIKTEIAVREESSFERAHGVRDLVIRSLLAIVGLTGIVIGLPLIITSIF